MAWHGGQLHEAQQLHLNLSDIWLPFSSGGSLRYFWDTDLSPEEVLALGILRPQLSSKSSAVTKFTVRSNLYAPEIGQLPVMRLQLDAVFVIVAVGVVVSTARLIFAASDDDDDADIMFSYSLSSSSSSFSCINCCPSCRR